MIGLSTSWRSAKAESGKELIEDLIQIGVEALELEYRITRDMLREVIPIIRRESLPILSVHNFCPVPAGIPRHKASADVFLLSSADREERKLAIEHSLETMRLAHDLEVKAVVFHVGKVDMDARKEHFAELFDKGEIDAPNGRIFIEKQLALRGKKRWKNLDSVLFSLEKLNREAEKLGVTMGIENRYHFHEIPDFEEVGIILKEFRGGRI